MIDILTRLREMGSTVAIDDFGTGYSSLSYLERLPADRLKIDRSFVQSLERDDNGSRIARTIIALGRELDLTILAEGSRTNRGPPGDGAGLRRGAGLSLRPPDERGAVPRMAASASKGIA